MLRLTLAVVFAMAAVTLASPPFCRTLDCPVYTVIKSTDNYEVRMYNNSEWAQTGTKGMDYTATQQAGFQRLFGYISGDNNEKKSVPMTAPVTVQCPSVGGKIFSEKAFNVSFMVPFKFQPNPPRPSAANVQIVADAQRVMYVSAYPGFSTESDVVQQATNLMAALKADNVNFDADQFWTAGYDSPFQLFNRHNEIWFAARQ